MASLSDLDFAVSFIAEQGLYPAIRNVDTEVDAAQQATGRIFAQVIEDVMANVPSKLDLKAAMTAAVKKIDARDATVQKVTELFLQVFDQAGAIEFESMKANQDERRMEFDHWIRTVFPQFLTVAYSPFVEPVDPDTIQIPEASQPIMKEKEKDVSALWCYEYALIRSGDPRVLDVDDDEPYNVGDMPSALQNWGYTPIPANQRRPGDLVVFVSSDLQPHHTAIYRGNGVYESKWWDSIPVPFLHTIDKVPSSDGKIVLFFRPPAKAAVVSPPLSTSSDQSSPSLGSPSIPTDSPNQTPLSIGSQAESAQSDSPG